MLHKKIGLLNVVMTLVLGLCLTTGAVAQEILVRGTVIGEDDNSPIPGATVIVEGTTKGTVTDIDGNFSLNANKGDKLKISFVGMEPMTVPVTGEKMNITMTPNIEGLEEVIVVGYGSQKKKEITGSVARVDSEILQQNVASDIGVALQGQIAGVSVTSSTGAPGENSNIQIRGITSVFGNNGPLWVVDGIPQDGDPRLTANEIATIDVLKDAASASIYGTRGAAGVILVTTKQGEAGRISVGVNSSVGVRNITASTPVMNAAEQEYFEITSAGNIAGTPKDLVTSGYARSPFSILNDTDLKDIVYVDNAITQDHNVNITGGTQKISYNVTAGYYKQEGVIINSDFERINARASTSYKKGKLSIRGVIGYQQEETDRATQTMFTQTTRYLPSQQALDPDLSEPVESNGFGAGAQRLNWVLNSLQNIDIFTRDRMQTSFNISYDLTNDLKFQTNYGATVMHTQRDRFNKYTPHFSPDGEELSNRNDSFVENESGKNTSSSIDFGLTYNKKIGDHTVTLTAFTSAERYEYSGFRARKTNVSNNQIQVLNSASENPEAVSLDSRITTFNGMLGRVRYNYKGKYLVSANVRRDGSSRFGEEKYETFPSFSLGWQISDEPFFKPLKNIVDNLKFRGSWGNTGNANFGDYEFASTIAQGIDYTFGSSSTENPLIGAAQQEYANQLVKWETSRQVNLGFDLDLFESKLTVSADYYDTKKEDMLFNVTVPPSSGAFGANRNVVLNVGNMTNSGYELTLGYRNRIGELDYSINATYTSNDNVVTKMNTDGFIFLDGSALIGGDPASLITVLSEGYEAGAFFLNETNGIVKTGEQLEEYRKLVPTAQLGDLIFVDANGDSVINNDDRTYHGSGLPDYEIGMNVNLKYKGFDFLMQWYGSFGFEIMNGSHADASSWGRHSELLNAWSPANQNSDIPAYRGNSKEHPNSYAFTDRWLEDGSYARLKVVTLGYSFPSKITDRMGLSQLRFYVSAQNPITITDYTGFDPEIGGNGLSTRGLDRGNYPVTSFYLMGVNLKF